MNEREHKGFSCFKNLFKAPAQHKKFLFVTTLLVLFYTCTGNHVKKENFDYFVFSQRWLPSACIEYVEHNSSNNDHECLLPSNYQSWAIHGFWPTQNKQVGPFFCNNSMVFDMSKLKPIEADLKLYWPNIEKGKGSDSLWEHEWNKHGTCAAQLESLDSEFKYFNTTLKFYKMYAVQSVLNNNNIFPNSHKGLLIKNVFIAIKSTFGKMPIVHCIKEVKTRRAFLSEIRLCFNLNLELINCGETEDVSEKEFDDLVSGSSLTNCPLRKKIIYPDTIGPKLDEVSLTNSVQMNFYDSLVKILSVIRFLQWISI